MKATQAEHKNIPWPESSAAVNHVLNSDKRKVNIFYTQKDHNNIVQTCSTTEMSFYTLQSSNSTT